MAQYRAKEDIDAGREKFKKGQVVDVNQIPQGYLGKFSLIGFEKNVPADAGDSADVHDDDASGGEGGEGGETKVGNPSRDELKQMATDMGLTFPSNISTAKLQEMVNEKAKEINEGGE